MGYTKSINVKCMDCGHVNLPHETKNLFYIIEARYCEKCGSRSVDVEYSEHMMTKK